MSQRSQSAHMTNKLPIGFAEFNFCRELQNKQQQQQAGARREASKAARKARKLQYHNLCLKILMSVRACSSSYKQEHSNEYEQLFIVEIN